jgi:hypothetical protein
MPSYTRVVVEILHTHRLRPPWARGIESDSSNAAMTFCWNGRHIGNDPPTIAPHELADAQSALVAHQSKYATQRADATSMPHSINLGDACLASSTKSGAAHNNAKAAAERTRKCEP